VNFLLLSNLDVFAKVNSAVSLQLFQFLLSLQGSLLSSLNPRFSLSQSYLDSLDALVLMLFNLRDFDKSSTILACCDLLSAGLIVIE
jgi:hypothetical protein